MGVQGYFQYFMGRFQLWHPTEYDMGYDTTVETKVDSKPARPWIFQEFSYVWDSLNFQILVPFVPSDLADAEVSHNDVMKRFVSPFETESLVTEDLEPKLDDEEEGPNENISGMSSSKFRRKSYFFNMTQLTISSPGTGTQGSSLNRFRGSNYSSLGKAAASKIVSLDPVPQRTHRSNSIKVFLESYLARRPSHNEESPSHSPSRSMDSPLLFKKPTMFDPSRQAQSTAESPPATSAEMPKLSHGQVPVREALENKILVSDLKFLWTDPIRKAVSAWWKKFLENDQPESETSRPNSTAQDEKDNNSLDPSSLLSDELPIRKNSLKTQLSLSTKTEEQMFQEEPASSDSAFFLKLYTILFERPQVNFSSNQAKGRLVLTANNAKVELGAFEMPDFEEFADTLSALKRASLSKKKKIAVQRLYYKRSISFTFAKAQLFVAPTGIDLNQSSQWIPSSYFSVLEKLQTQESSETNGSSDPAQIQNFYFAKSKRTSHYGLLEEVTSPAVINFLYLYDTGLHLLSKESEMLWDEFKFRLQHRATSGTQPLKVEKISGPGDLTVKEIHEFAANALAPTVSTKVSFSDLSACMNGRQFRTMVQVANALFIEPVESERDTLYAEFIPTKETLLAEIENVLGSRFVQPSLIMSPRISQSGAVVTRNVEYFVKSATWMLTDDIISSQEGNFGYVEGKIAGKFLEAHIKELLGRHHFRHDGSVSFDFSLKDAVLFDEVKNKKVLSASQLESESIVRICSDTFAPLGEPDPTSSLQQCLTATTPYQKFDVSMVPLTLDFSQDLYAILRRYFFEKNYDVDAGFIPTSFRERSPSNLSPGIGVEQSPGGVKEKRSKLSKAEMKRKEKRNQVEVPAFNYFNRLKISKVEIVASFQGIVNFEDLKVVIVPFQADKKLWDWNKLVARLEKHVYSNVIGQATDIGKNLLGFGRKNQARKSQDFTSAHLMPQGSLEDIHEASSESKSQKSHGTSRLKAFKTSISKKIKETIHGHEDEEDDDDSSHRNASMSFIPPAPEE
jgi:hypothetical protein